MGNKDTNKVKVISKGYTIEVTSWENDGDNYKTEKITVDTKEEAKALVDLCKTVFVSCNNGSRGIGNMCDSSEGASDIIIPYMKANPILYKILYEDEIIEDDNHLVDICMDINYQLMDGSEFYYSRVFESATVTYSPEDIYLELVEF